MLLRSELHKGGGCIGRLYAEEFKLKTSDWGKSKVETRKSKLESIDEVGIKFTTELL
ncbi:MAG: hypothetical protein MUD14_07635 [Hydrococcus sp. Prado102]|jgi:hypothetical protein|nr:hypothetical protein [Hydrococcus sp. Prado102]